jgi:outer membrane protein, heavy metal efflux system
MRSLRRVSTALSAVLLGWLPAACVHHQRYQPAPIDASDEAARYRGRRLDDPGLARFLTAAGVAPDTGWSATGLGLAALYFRNDLGVARAGLAEAEAATVTAGVRPAVGVDAGIERGSRVEQGLSSPWTVSLTTGLTLETGGKRSARIARARAGALLARLGLDVGGRHVAEEARWAAIATQAADAEVLDARTELTALRTVATLLRARYAQGQLSLTELARADADADGATLTLAQAERGRIDARSALARALAVPEGAIDTLTIRSDPSSPCDTIDLLAVDTLVARALQTRPDVGAALATYAEAEADVRLAVAEQYPNLTLAPGISWDQGIVRWLLSFGLPALVTPRRARGPIAEAEARRAEQAARVNVVQDSVLSAVDASVLACQVVRREGVAADSAVGGAARVVELARGAYDRGETGRTEVAVAELALVRARHARQLAIARRRAAGATLDVATGAWLASPTVRWPNLAAPPTEPKGQQ